MLRYRFIIDSGHIDIT